MRIGTTVEFTGHRLSDLSGIAPRDGVRHRGNTYRVLGVTRDHKRMKLRVARVFPHFLRPDLPVHYMPWWRRARKTRS